MKRYSLILCSLLLVLGVTAVAAPEGQTEISVAGTGSVSLAPDQATVSASIDTYSANAGEAVSANNDIYNRVVAAVQALSIQRADVALTSYNISYNPKPTKVEPGDTNRYGYNVTRQFAVTVHNIAKSGNVVDAVTHAGATGINSIDFGVADNSQAQAKAQGMAVADSRKQAEALAAAAHLHIVGIKLIDYNPGAGGVRPMPMMKMSAMAATPTQLDPSSVNVTATVSVVYLAAP